MDFSYRCSRWSWIIIITKVFIEKKRYNFRDDISFLAVYICPYWFCLEKIFFLRWRTHHRRNVRISLCFSYFNDVTGNNIMKRKWNSLIGTSNCWQSGNLTRGWTRAAWLWHTGGCRPLFLTRGSKDFGSSSEDDSDIFVPFATLHPIIKLNDTVTCYPSSTGYLCGL